MLQFKNTAFTYETLLLYVSNFRDSISGFQNE